MFPNYFTSQKARAKITKAEEQEGSKLFLGLLDKQEKDKAALKKPVSAKKAIKSRSR